MSTGLDKDQLDAVASWLHNTASELLLNTADSDVEWLGRRLYELASNFGGGAVETMPWSLSNEEFKKLGLLPNRKWVGKNWFTLPRNRKLAWIKLARACMCVLPEISERIANRFMAQSRAIRNQNDATLQAEIKQMTTEGEE